MAPVSASASAPVALDPPGADEGPVREAEAVLRWRARTLRDQFAVREAEGARLFPVLLHASFKNSTLTADPPGVPGMAYRRSWVAWAADFGLSPPWRTQKGECVAEAVFALAGASGLELVVIVPAEATGGARRILEERVDLAAGVLRAGKVTCVATVLDMEAFCSTRSAARLLLFGSMLAGRLSSSSCRSLLRAWRAPLSSEDIAWIFDGAPTSLSSLAVGILAAGGVAGPLDAIEGCIRSGVSARALAAPDAAPVAWAGAVTRTGPDLDLVLGLLHPGSSVYPRPSGAGGDVQPPPRDPAVAVQVGGRLALAFVKAVRRSHTLRASDRWREVIGAGGPRALLPLIGGGLRESAASGILRPGLEPEPGKAGFAIQLGPGALARGATSIQARVRALALLAEAGDATTLATLDPKWKALATRLARPRTRPALLVVVEDAVGSEPPLDPINRGPLRRVAIPPALVVHLGSTRRPSGRVLPGDQAVETLIRAAHAGDDVEVIPANGTALKAALRLTDVARMLAPGTVSLDAPKGAPALPVAIQAGGRVYLTGRRKVRRFPLERFMNRPRAFLADPDGPDLVMAPGDRSTSGRDAKGIIQLRTSLSTEPGMAWLLYLDGASRFREHVALQELKEHIRDTRSVLQDVQAGAALALRSDPEMEAARRNAGAGHRSRRFEVETRGELPYRLQVRVAAPNQLNAWSGDEWFGGAGSAGWEAAALSVMAHWVPGEEGRIVCRRSRVVTRPGCPVGLVSLYARSIVIRRMTAHIQRLMAPYRRVE